MPSLCAAQDSVRARTVPLGSFEGTIEYRVSWWGPLAAEYGRMLPSGVRITVRGGQVRSETLGGLYPVVSLLDADSNRAYALDSLTRSAWMAPLAGSTQPRMRLSAPTPAGSIAGQAVTGYTLLLTWPDPTPDLPKPPDYQPTQVVQQVRVAPGLKHALGGQAGRTLGLLPLGRLPGWPLRVEGPVAPDRQLRMTLVATRVTRRKVVPAEVDVPAGYTVRPFDARGPIPGFNGLEGLVPGSR